MQRPPGRNDAASPVRVLVFVVSYNAERFIRDVVARIPVSLHDDPNLSVDLLIIDDCSPDSTFRVARDLPTRWGRGTLTLLRNPSNLGYGGNQKVGYHHAVTNGYDVVALVHGDGQYAPEELPRLIEPLIRGEAEAVFGSRMIAEGGARAGGMPLYKRIGNRVLTTLQNRITGARLSEWHSGYRLYSVRALAAVPFDRNSNGFDFDTDIILQFLLSGFRIREVPIPTHYGDETCHVDGVDYARRIIISCLQSRMQRLGLFYDRRFDVNPPRENYQPKFDFTSSHSLALARIRPDDRLLILGSGSADLVRPFRDRAKSVIAVELDQDPAIAALGVEVHTADLNTCDLARIVGGRRVTRVLLLDVIEHLADPEAFMERLRVVPGLEDAEVVITTPNIAFLPMRLMLLLGQFNYGRRGILDRTHTRLFTFASLRTLLLQQGFDVGTLEGIPAPFPLALGRASALGRVLLRANELALRVLRGLFSFQILATARPRPTLDTLLARSVQHTDEYARSLEDSPAPRARDGAAAPAARHVAVD
jgi:glycosyltransferase involved in cell wall biosynthesis